MSGVGVVGGLSVEVNSLGGTGKISKCFGLNPQEESFHISPLSLRIQPEVLISTQNSTKHGSPISSRNRTPVNL